MVSLEIGSMVAITDAGTASLHRFDWGAFYAPAILHVVVIIFGVILIFTALSRRKKIIAILIIACGLIGIAIIGLTALRTIADTGSSKADWWLCQ